MLVRATRAMQKTINFLPETAELIGLMSSNVFSKDGYHGLVWLRSRYFLTADESPHSCDLNHYLFFHSTEILWK